MASTWHIEQPISGPLRQAELEGHHLGLMATQKVVDDHHRHRYLAKPAKPWQRPEMGKWVAQLAWTKPWEWVEKSRAGQAMDKASCMEQAMDTKGR